ncbi:unnamed protein product (macronuclear) [Paramecium tetraurelia]|uniref:Uncharacterized protein n=1 Tax=Paramecium tetraurelia TaxID=5888 RepID=A0BFW4_PARTE|nr:uncharacterized protein GSPATT00028466001 [Paramecium tetraurelia]CAK57431.1 unnamed protein product [Paramecium tetraurelia]|eukprot:XP_001424829.1 hypothetical protein (macronuclear) [Paramecium tetraurelia strain d4-2]
MEGQQYQYLMADEYFLENNESYSSFSLGDIQFLVNLNDFEAPIFQPSKIHNPYVSLVGNYCMADSSIIFINKVDPIFVAIRVLRNKLANQQQENSIEFENIFNGEDTFEVYLSKHKQIRQNIDCISNKKEIGDEIYVKLDKGKLFQFLDVKYNSIRQYSQKSVYFVDDCNQKKQDESELKICDLFKQYIGEQLYNDYQATKKIVIANQTSKFEFHNEQNGSNIREDKEVITKKTQSNSKRNQETNEKQVKNNNILDQYFKKITKQPEQEK